MSAQIIEINTDSLIFLSQETKNIFTSNFKQYVEYFKSNSDLLLDMNFYLDPVKIVYDRKYFKVLDVVNNVSSMLNILSMILSFICRKYNDYKLKVNFIEENIMYKGDKDEENILNLILIPPEESGPANMDPLDYQNSQELQKKKKKFNSRLSKNIKMKGYFEFLLCCKDKQSNRNAISNVAEEFYKEFIDARSIILLLSQLKDLKNVSLQKYQKIILNETKIILDEKEMLIMKQDDVLLQNCFQILKTKIQEKNLDGVDLMLVNKF